MTPRSFCPEGEPTSPPGRKPPAPIYEINNVTEAPVGFSRVTAPGQSGHGLSYRPPGSFLVSTGGSILSRAEGQEQLVRALVLLGMDRFVAVRHGRGRRGYDR